MNVYIYRAALYCEDCGKAICAELGHKFDGVSEYDFDSDEYPKGPFLAGESDGPEHCDCCGLFLENPLTGDGENYVLDTLLMADYDPEPVEDRPWLDEWADFYSYLFD